MGIFKNMGGNIPGGNFLGGNFPGGNFPGRSLMGGWEFSRWEFSRYLNRQAKIFLRIPLLINLFIFLIKEHLLKNLIKEHTFLYLVTYLFI